MPSGSRKTALRHTAELGRRIEAAIEAAEQKPLVRLVREDVVGRVVVFATVALAWFALGLLDLRIALLAIACGAVTTLRLKRLPPADAPDPDDWL